MPWDAALGDTEILAVHAAFLNSGKILLLGGDQHDPDLHAKGLVDATRLYDCGTGTVETIPSPPFDAFCCGQAISAGGTLLVAGGTRDFPLPEGEHHHGHFPGLRDAAAYRLGAPQVPWSRVADLSEGESDGSDGPTGGRWYPTLVTLAGGDVLALSGHPGSGDREHSNYIPEVFTPQPSGKGSWHRLGSFTDPKEDALFRANDTPYYPRAFLLPTGDVLIATPTFDGNMTRTLTVGRNPWKGTFDDVCEFTPLNHDHNEFDYGGYAQSAVLLPLRHDRGYAASVLLTGGRDAWRLDLAGWRPGGKTPANKHRWERTSPRTLSGRPRRLNNCATLLPTGEVLVTGGVAGKFNAQGDLERLDSTAVLPPELYDPKTGQWHSHPSEPAHVVRNYHSVALLMPDGRVWTAGSDHDAAVGIQAAELRVEIYEPWYIGQKNRPEILAAPDRWTTGKKYRVSTTQAKDIREVVIVRTGSCTHAFNADQRLISLAFVHTGGDDLEVEMPPDGNVSPTGVYFIYTVNSKGLPSAGVTLYVSDDPENEAERQWRALTG